MMNHLHFLRGQAQQCDGMRKVWNRKVVERLRCIPFSIALDKVDEMWDDAKNPAKLPKLHVVKIHAYRASLPHYIRSAPPPK